jgi:hypothetical protein
VNPVDPGMVTNMNGERISINGFWHMWFMSNIVNRLSVMPADENGDVTVVLPGNVHYGRLLQHPAGYPSGRVHLRAFAEDGSEAADLYLSITAVL